MKKEKKSFEIALSAISCAIATIFLVIGTINNYFLTTGYIIGCLAMTIPLSRGFWAGDILAYIASVLLTLLLGGAAFFWRLLPFIAFFGLYPLVNYVQSKFKLNNPIAFVAKALWFDGMLFFVWKFIFDMTSRFELLDEYIVPVVLIGGTIAFVVYDYMIVRCQLSVNRLIDKIKKR